MKTRTTLAAFCFTAALALAACSQDSMQPTASRMAYKTDDPGDGAQVPGPAAVQPSTRPIADFLSTQGQWCAKGPDGACQMYVPPTPNMIYYYDSQNDLSVAIDYAGMMEKWVMENGGAPLGTHIDGEIIERPKEDGSAIVSIRLTADRAAVFAVRGPSLNAGPTYFGDRVADRVRPGQAPPANGRLTMSIDFVTSGTNLKIPDLMQLVREPEAKQKLLGVRMDFEGVGAYGPGSPMPGTMTNFRLTQSGSVLSSFPGDPMMSPAMAPSQTSFTMP